MSQYNFHNFDDYEFEILCRDLINEEQRLVVKNDHGFGKKKPFIINFSSYKKGKDKGVDLYYFNEKEKIKVIGQIKLSRGKFQDLFAAINKKINGKNELDKVRELKPNKYIFITSVPLSLENKKRIKEYFEPYIIRLEDIYGLEDLNKLIGEFPRIEKRYLKLYFHSPLILENLLNQATLSKSFFELKEIQSEFSFYVQTSHFGEALSILEDQRILIIKGPPGAGKTTLAKMLALYFTTQDYQFITIDNLDNEIERLISDNEKAIYYYDDFLGSNELILKDALSNDAKLNRLIRQISTSRTKFLVLTSRTTILNHAKSASEKLKSLFEKIQKFELKVDDINIKEKQLILKRHLQRGKIPETSISDDLIDFILNQKTFSPRLIQFVTDRYENYKNNFDEFVRQSILFPDEIWRFAYQKEIDFTCQIFLNHLFLLGLDYNLSGFRVSFENRLSYETSINHFTQTGSEFRNCIDKLDDAFIQIQAYITEKDESPNYTVKFLNPSVGDFLLKEVRNNPLIIKNSIRSFDDINLLTNRFNHRNKELLNLFTIDELEQILLNRDIDLILSDPFFEIEYLKILSEYFSIKTIERKRNNLITKCLDLELLESTNNYLSFLISYKASDSTQKFIEKNLRNLADFFFRQCIYINDFEETITLFEDLGYNINYLIKKIDRSIFEESFERILHDRIDQLVYIKSDYIFSYEKIDEIIFDVQNEFNRYQEYHFDTNKLIQNKVNEINWDHIISYNKNRFSGSKI